jgi:hypothetical protein
MAASYTVQFIFWLAGIWFVERGLAGLQMEFA